MSLSDLLSLHKAKTLEMYSFEEFASEALLLDILMISILYAMTLLFTFDFNWENFPPLFIEDAVLDEESLSQETITDREELEENNGLRYRHAFFQTSDPNNSIQSHQSLRF